jgi:hypothetical protein
MIREDEIIIIEDKSKPIMVINMGTIMILRHVISTNQDQKKKEKKEKINKKEDF